MISIADHGLKLLRAASPLRGATTEEVLANIFPAGSLLCVGSKTFQFSTDTLENLSRTLDLNKLSFVCYQPMTARYGRTREGKLHNHCKNNTHKDRIHIVIEFDPEQKPETPEKLAAEQDRQAGILLHLCQFASLVLVVWSGGKSLQGWFSSEGCPAEDKARLMRYAVSLGADAKVWAISQTVRMPNGTRDDGSHQEVVYYNPGLPAYISSEVPTVTGIRLPGDGKAAKVTANAPKAPKMKSAAVDAVDTTLTAEVLQHIVGPAVITKYHSSNEGIFRLARRCLHLSSNHNEAIIRCWYNASLPFLGHSLDHYRSAFERARNTASYPDSQLLQYCSTLATAETFPATGSAARKHLISTAWHLSQFREQFHLSGRDAATVAKVSGRTGKTMLDELVRDGILTRVSKGNWDGDDSGESSKYLFTGGKAPTTMTTTRTPLLLPEVAKSLVEATIAARKLKAASKRFLSKDTDRKLAETRGLLSQVEVVTLKNAIRMAEQLEAEAIKAKKAKDKEDAAVYSKAKKEAAGWRADCTSAKKWKIRLIESWDAKRWANFAKPGEWIIERKGAIENLGEALEVVVIGGLQQGKFGSFFEVGIPSLDCRCRWYMSDEQVSCAVPGKIIKMGKLVNAGLGFDQITIWHHQTLVLIAVQHDKPVYTETRILDSYPTQQWVLDRIANGANTSALATQKKNDFKQRQIDREHRKAALKSYKEEEAKFWGRSQRGNQ